MNLGLLQDLFSRLGRDRIRKKLGPPLPGCDDKDIDDEEVEEDGEESDT